MSYDTIRLLTLYYLQHYCTSFDPQINKYRQKIKQLFDYDKINVDKLIEEFEYKRKYDFSINDNYASLMENKSLKQAIKGQKKILIITPEGKSSVEKYIKENDSTLSKIIEIICKTGKGIVKIIKTIGKWLLK